ncbi:hypothetical protein GCE86_03935 [Micromonospora terminaliae]|uniref:Uncharacterized protein n=1 Tax=Micromonospora terminaliae TaxID=1914461 RepID=A0AAJ3DLM6_9ACTN|nr:hypothetical protein [Micromonospora terminaliae]NES31039.1 hypothetical protein [Micromonospora terminaliae]QGL46273.1 hypothetical protein GCE86_03935 [Micromonospora terminaliae]
MVVDRMAPWSRETFADGVRVVELATLQRRMPMTRIEQAVLYKAPRKLLRTVGRGPLRGFSQRAERAYQKRFADRAHRAFVRLRGDTRAKVIARVGAQPRVDVLVVTDPVAMPHAARLIGGDHAPSIPRVCFSYDYAGLTPEGQHRPDPDFVQGDNQ